jgi:hypothetical protein
MRRWLLAAGLILGGFSLSAQAPSIPLDELHALRVENFVLKHQPTLTQCQQFEKQTTTDWNTLEQQIRTDLHVTDDLILNPQTKAFEPKPLPPK